MSAWMEEREGVERSLARTILAVAALMALAMVIVMLRVRRLEGEHDAATDLPKRKITRRPRIVTNES
jgi:hypothetical protein